MRPPVSLIVAAVLAVVVCHEMADQAAAKVVLAGRTDPAVPTGGIKLPPGRRITAQFSLIGALAAEGRWFGQCAFWPWRMIGPPPPYRPGPVFRLPQRPVIDWVPPPMP